MHTENASTIASVCNTVPGVDSTLIQGGVAVAIILTLAVLIRSLAELIKASRA